MSRQVELFGRRDFAAAHHRARANTVTAATGSGLSSHMVAPGPGRCRPQVLWAMNSNGSSSSTIQNFNQLGNYENGETVTKSVDGLAANDNQRRARWVA